MILQNSNAIEGAAPVVIQDTARSIRFRSNVSGFKYRVFSTPTNNLKWTWGGWLKRGALGSVQQILNAYDGTTFQTYVRFAADDTLEFFGYNSASGTYLWQLVTTQYFRDPAAWFHLVLVYDSANTTATDRAIVYVNGVRVTSFITPTYPTLNLASAWNASGLTHRIGTYLASSSFYEGYLSKENFVDGQALDATAFGQFDINGVWIPKTYTGSVGQNGYYSEFLDGSSTTSLGFDSATNPVGQDITSSVSTATVSSTQAAPGLTTSMYLNGAVDKCWPIAADDKQNLSTGVFSLEAWVYYENKVSLPQGNNGAVILSQGNNATNTYWQLAIVPGTRQVMWGYTGAGITVSATYAVPLTTWTHILVTRDAYNIERVFVNGVLANQRTNTTNYGSVSDFVTRIGSGYDTNYPSAYSSPAVGNVWNGYINNVRVVVGAIPAAYRTSATTLGQSVFTPTSLVVGGASDVWGRTAIHVPGNGVAGSRVVKNLTPNNWITSNISLAAVQTYSLANTDTTRGTGMFGNTILPVVGDGTNAVHVIKSNSIVCTLSKPITATTKIELYCYTDNTASSFPYSVTANGGTAKVVPSSPTAWSWVKVDLGVTSLSTLTVTNSNSTNSDLWISCIIVDDVVFTGYYASSYAYDWMLDSPVNNFPVMNPLDFYTPGTPTNGQLPFNGNLQLAANATSWSGYYTNFLLQSGKWYVEASFLAGTAAAGNVVLAIHNVDANTRVQITPVNETDKVAIAVDLDTGSYTTYRNNVVVATGSLTVGNTHVFYGTAGNGYSLVLNFGQRPFAYTPPTGFKALCTANLPAAAIPNPKAHFVTGSRTSSGVGQTFYSLLFRPGLIWEKSRNLTSDHLVIDEVRGAANNLTTNNTNAELSRPNYITSINSNGFTTGSGDYPNGTTVLSWMWNLASAVALTNTVGAKTSQVLANVTAGISVVKTTLANTNTNVGHGLNSPPTFIIGKRTDGVSNWPVYSSSMGADKAAYINLTNSQAVDTSIWQSVAPTSSVFYTGDGLGFTWVFYCFAEVLGFSRFRKYIGNGLAAGTYVNCGFSPAWVVIKRLDSTGEWRMHDIVRNPNNIANLIMRAEQTLGEGVSPAIDFLSNGFKLRSTDVNINGSGGTYMFMAFADKPFGGANVSPATAR